VPTANARVIEVSYYDPILEKSSDHWSRELVEPPAIKRAELAKLQGERVPAWIRFVSTTT